MHNNFYSTVGKTKLYEILISSAIIHSKQILKKDIFFKEKKKNKIPSLNLLKFLMKNLITLKVFNLQKYLLLKYRNGDIGIHAASYTFVDNRVYFSKLLLFFKLFKNLVIAGNTIDHGHQIVKNAGAIYIDHVGYLTGLYIKIFALRKKIIYFGGYPKGFCFIDFNIKKNLTVYNSGIIKVRPSRKKISQHIVKTNKKRYENILRDPKTYLKWMRYTSYSKSELKSLDYDLKKVKYIVYAHSFCDGQLFFGLDGFPNLYEWLEFTLSELKKQNKNIIVKGHPNFFNKFFGKMMKEDLKIFLYFKKKYESEQIKFIDFPVENSKILEKISNKTILVSHHGTAILEGTYAGFKSIFSTATMWTPDFKVGNQWSSRNEYKNLLNKNHERLKLYNSKNLFYDLSNQIFFSKYAHGGSSNWYTIIEKYTQKINWKKTITQPHHLIKLIKFKKNKDKIILDISKNIENVKI